MSIVKTICTSLFLSVHAISAAAADVIPPAPVEQPKPAVVDASHLTEVIQVLFLANASQLDGMTLALERNPDKALQSLVEDMRRDHLWMQDTLEAQAQRHGISLKQDDLTLTSQQVKKNVDVDFQALSQTSPADFRGAFLKFTIYQHRKILKLYDQIEQLNQDAGIKARITIFRPLIAYEILIATSELEGAENSVPTSL
jgi:predicted outer membrane protein